MYCRRMIGSRVRYYRRLRGLYQTQLAKMAGLSRTTVARIECELHPPNITTLKRIADALDITMTDLVREE